MRTFIGQVAFPPPPLKAAGCFNVQRTDAGGVLLRVEHDGRVEQIELGRRVAHKLGRMLVEATLRDEQP